jgi:hypothetical protein
MASSRFSAARFYINFPKHFKFSQHDEQGQLIAILALFQQLINLFYLQLISVFLPIGPIINKNVENMLDSTKFITVDEV